MIHYGCINEHGDLVFEFRTQQRAYCKAKFGVGGVVDVEIREHREKRSDRQNRALWALLHAWCEEADQGWRPDDLKDAVMGEVFGRIEVKQPLTGEMRLVPARMHTSTLNVTDFCKVIEAILELAATSEPPVFLESPDEYRKARQKKAA